MSDLISRQEAIDALAMADAKKGWRSLRFSEMRKCLSELPSAQTDVVRCKDCKFYEIYELKADYTDDKRYKPSVCVKRMYAVKRSEDWFCADAERRTDG